MRICMQKYENFDAIYTFYLSYVTVYNLFIAVPIVQAANSLSHSSARKVPTAKAPVFKFRKRSKKLA